MRSKPVSRIMLTLLLICELTSAFNIGSATPSTPVIPVIVDMDVDPSDTGALLYLLKHPGISVRAITVSCGVTYVDAGVTNVLRLLDYLGIRGIPVAAGKDKPLATDNAFPTELRGASLNFYGLYLPPTDLQPSKMNASELIISVINSSAEKITLVSSGPLTNIAMALQAEPSIKNGIKVIHSMGGAVTVPGNVGYEYPPIHNYVAEWNIWVDPHAADIVFKSGIPITLIPLDATNEVPTNENFRTKLQSVMRTPEAEIVHQFIRPGLGAYFWDQLTAVALTDPSVVTFESHYIEVLIDSENQTGWTQSLGQDPPNTQVAVHADANTFENLFLEIINNPEPPFIPEFHSGTFLLALTIAVAGITVVFKKRATQSPRKLV